MTRSPAIALPLLLLGGCSLLGGGNSMHARGDAPFSLGKVKSALWAESRWSDAYDGEGSAYLMLSSESLDCDGFFDEVNGDVREEDSIVWNSDGVALRFDWYDPGGEDEGFEGQYTSGLYPLGYDYDDDSPTLRVFSLTAFSDHQSWQDEYGLGKATISDFSDSAVEGTAKTAWVSLRFDAENCGRVPDGGFDYDSYDYYYYD